MKMFFCLILLITAVKLNAEEGAPAVPVVDNSLEEKKSNYQITSRYKAGTFLIYDCRGEYYACVDEYSSEKCREARTDSTNKKEQRYPCSPLKKFDTKQACLAKNYEVIESMALKRFCYPK